MLFYLFKYSLTLRIKYDITLLVVINTDKKIDISLEYQSTIMTEVDAASLANYFEKLLEMILADPMTITTEVNIVSDIDLARITTGPPVPAATNLCTHWLIDEQIKSRTNEPAVVSWDRNLTYGELDIFASRLAFQLQKLGVGPEVLVPICFPKSAWTIVAMIAIEKAGGAFVPLDPAAPPARLRSILDDTRAVLALAAPSYKNLLQSLDIKTLVVDEETVASLADPVGSLVSTVQPHNASFIIFTSGTTGKPKGIVIEHSGTCATAEAYGSMLHIGPGTRVFQFSAYTFDVGVWDVLITLMRGGCVCVPSDHARIHNLAGAINDSRANWTFLTPTVADLLDPADVPGLKLVCLGGEAIRKKCTDRWKDAVELHAIYGPTEASCCAWDSNPGNSGNIASIGKPLSSIFWIVEPDNPRHLVPVGCIGELLVQGPMLARGYLVNDKKTASNWIENIDWLPNTSLTRAYCTGDLVRSNSDGTFGYVGRKDTQIKLNGQRIELGEIESRMQEFLPEDISGIVDILGGGDNGPKALTAFLWFTGGPRFRQGNVQLVTSLSKDMHKLISHLGSALGAVLPSYMMPTTYLILEGEPERTSSGKVNRRALVSLGQKVPAKERFRFSSELVKSEPPSTMMEMKLREIWAEILHMSAQDIGRNDSFLRLGGDSVSTIRLVTLARQNGIWLTVAKIFIDPRLSAVAASAVTADGNTMFDIEPFSLLPPEVDVDMITSYAINQCGLSAQQSIEDAYWCTQLQEGLMALAVKQPRSYIAKYVFRLPKHVDARRFKTAWEQTIRICSNLRTRIMLIEGFSIQVVIKDDISWEVTDSYDVKSFMSAAREIDMTYGSRLCRYALIEDSVGECHFVWAVHHAVFDGWTMRTVIQTLYKLYNNTEVPALPPYSSFVKYTTGLDKNAAREYWKTQLHEAKCATFPPSSSNPVSSGGLVTKTIPFPRLTNSSITKATILRAAWAVVLARYCDTNDVCFATTVSGRHAPVLGVERIAGLAVATVPIRVRLDSQQSVSKFLLDIQNQASDMVAYEQYGLQNIAKVSDDAKDACDFSSLLVIQPIEQMYSTDDVADNVLAPVSWKKDDREEWIESFFTYPLVMQGLIMDDQVDLHVTYDSAVLTEEQLIGLCHQFGCVIKQLASQSDAPLHTVSLTGQWDIDQAMERNSHEPEIIDSCVHQLVERQAKERPDAPAIRAWDRTFTYSELDAAANRLAHHLVSTFSIKLDELVHVCFEKSAWFFVAILAINKAGAAWVPLDPSHPVERQRHIIRQTAARLALVSPANTKSFTNLVANVVEVTPALDIELSVNQQSSLYPPICDASPHNAAYVLFTSGSTGTPKGLVMEHGSVCTSQMAICERLGLTSDVRILQFASFIFDLCIGEIIAPLISGACICVPSEHTRLNDLKRFIHDMEITWAFLTPSFARTLNPDDVPSLRLLLLAGEAVGRDVFDMWFGRVRLINGWGPAETCVFSTLHEWTSASKSPLTVGRPVGGSCWIVDPQDPTKLAPIGCIGEVVIQGPTLLREYLSNPVVTEATTLTILPEWAPRQSSSHWKRFYKSGDLCFYNPDGTIEFSSRKDTQVKIRGLRVELSEVEHHIKAGFPGIQQVAVDVFKTEGSLSLFSYLCFNKESENAGNANSDASSKGMFLPLTAELESQITAMIGYLNVTLPRYMIPTLFIPCRYMPLINSAKLDRNKLRAWTAMLNRQELERYALLDGQKRAPETLMESRMRKIWAEILHIPEESIGRDDSFLRIGGDSISAIQLVGMARNSGVEVTVKNIFDDPRLSVVASAAVDINSEAKSEIEPFSLLPPGIGIDDVMSIAQKQCELATGQTIEDAYPCTQLQEGLMALAVKQPRSYIAKYVFRLPKHINVPRFKKAWERTMQICSNLRTRIVLIKGNPMQVCVKNDAAWEVTDGHSVESFKSATQDTEMAYGSRLSRYSLTEDRNGERHFIWAVHHAVFDGWTMRIIIQTLHQAYNDTDTLTLPPYSSFVKYTLDLDKKAAGAYWKSQLHGATCATFPPPSTNPVSSGGLVTKTIPFPDLSNGSITKATILRAAWAIVLASYCNTNDICFGTTVSGRQATVLGIDRIAGLAVATVPIRVRLNSQQSVSNFLLDIQNQASDMVAYEQYGLQNIAKVSSDAKDACDFSSLLLIQPVQQIYSMDNNEDSILALPNSKDSTSQTDRMEGYFTYPLVVQGLIMDNRVDLHVTYDSNILTEAQLTGLCHQFSHVTQQLAKQSVRSETLLHTISLAGPWDLEEAIERNNHEPEIVQSCVHHLIEKQAKLHPDALAIHAWDCTFTYSQLDAAANRLSHYLVDSFGVGLDDLVHVCFEKSGWFIVAILAINKAGAAWVPLDPSHPIDRQRQSVRQTAATLALTSPANAKLCAELLANVVEVTPELDQELLGDLTSSSKPPLCNVLPHNAAYVLFTSGSTGTPKGLVIEHGSVCTSQTAICERLGMTPDVKMLQFASFVFDLCVGEIIAPLISGASVYVPSDFTRLNDLKGFIQDMDINWAILTPSFARTLNPDTVPNLKLLVLAGEAVSRDVFNLWFGKLRLINGWGPAETCVFSAIHEWTSATESPLTIGRPVGGSCWIVDPENCGSLAPIGCLGEVVIQGPTLLREYLSNPKATKDAIMTTLPQWTPRQSSVYWNRIYKTGDLCFYNPDGTIQFSGRKDTQVKIRGLRVELSDVEYHIQANLPGMQQVAVDVLKTETGFDLVSYLFLSKDSQDPDNANTDISSEGLFLPLTAELESDIKAMIGYLNVTLPQYMIPTIFIPCRYLPLINSAKLDRNKLRISTAKLSRQELEIYSLLDGSKRAPETEMEYRMQKIWAKILNLPEESIGRDDSFLRIGGDSISAIRLVSLAREVGIIVTIKTIFDDPRLLAVAAAAVSTNGESITETEPFSLLPTKIDVGLITSYVNSQCGLSMGQTIEDAYPCTKLQEGLMALAVKHPGSYLANYVFRIPRHIDIERFKSSWERTVAICSNLRTRIIDFEGCFMQILIKNDISWEVTDGHDLESFKSATQENEMAFGSRLCRYGLIEENNEHYFICSIHHTMFDGWTMRIILQTLHQAYHSLDIATVRPYSAFIKYTTNLNHEAASEYWKMQLQHAKRATFPTTLRPQGTFNPSIERVNQAASPS
jgi:amino acid adenylation domain-containing protein